MEKTFTQKRLGLEEKMAEFKETLAVLSLLDSKKVYLAWAGGTIAKRRRELTL